MVSTQTTDDLPLDRSRIERSVKKIGWAAVAVYFCLWIWWLTVPLALFDAINPRAADQIRDGMTDQNVVEILGRKADQEVDSTYRFEAKVARQKLWKGSYWRILVRFDAEGNVSGHVVNRNADFTKQNEKTIW